MKSVTSLSKRFRVSLALLTALATLPLGSAFHNAEAKPKDSAPAYGYRAKRFKGQKQKKYTYRERRDDRDDDRYGRTRASRRNDRNTARPNRRNERFDDRRNSDRDDRTYTTRYRTRVNSAGDRVREYFRVYNNR
jgi:hypothetical protein